jgi:hypothetical protein
MNPARRDLERTTMRATRTRGRARRRAERRHKAAPKAAVAAKPVAKLPPAGPQLVLYRLCKPGWAVIAEKLPNAQGTRFVCPFCPLSHRVPGPVRGFRKLRRAQWVKLRRVHE